MVQEKIGKKCKRFGKHDGLNHMIKKEWDSLT